ncbi:hypothetical protein REC12_20940 [Desulfosporosinus sp. PR]|uniref:hypothetical protein n=1 Tax=Candidatus Desulfosporosinus nitrosoreducens TaxID=3401928 RepID=UPI0027F3F241|nr:hypothetical protein [Desulfosporosinus sp. PR]MDQ7096066.1 hypothetical protein [Desulfosporosinus sp. PR]
MSITWHTIWEAHPEVFIAQNWVECPEDKKKANRLPTQYAYFMGGETTLRVGLIASSSILREEEFLLAGVLWGNRLSNGAKTIIYYVAPDFSMAFLKSISKIGGSISARAVYWREKLTPSLYLVPEERHNIQPRYSIGEERPDWIRWGQGLNPVTRQQLMIVNKFFSELSKRRIHVEFRQQHIAFLWGNFEIAEVRRNGKKFELGTKLKWLKDQDLLAKWQKQGWVDASGSLNQEFCMTVHSVIDYLEALENQGNLRSQDLLALWLHQGEGVLKSLWGSPWPWPWQPKDRSENSLLELEQWYYFQGNGQLSVICPIFEKPLMKAARSIILSSVLERSLLLAYAKDESGNSLVWDGRIHWLTTLGLEDELRRWYCWINNMDNFPIWTLPENWKEKGIYELNSRAPFNQSLMPRDYL